MAFPTASAALRSGFAALRTNPLRTFLSALGVVIGIGAMISVLALSDGVETSIRKQLAADGRVTTLRLQPRTTQMVDGLSMPRASFPFFGGKDADELQILFVKNAGTVDLTVSGPAFIRVAPGHKQRGVVLRGMRLAPARVRERPPVAGRFYSPEEGHSGAHVLVLTDALAAALATSLADSTAGPVVLPGQEAERRGAVVALGEHTQPSAAACRALVGRTVSVGDQPWQIVGILPPPEDTETECGGKTVKTTVRATAVSMFAIAPTRAVLGAIIPLPGRPIAPELLLTASRVEDLPALRQAAERWLVAKYGAAVGAFGGWKDEVDLASYERESESIRQGMLVFRLLMAAITGISLVVGGVGIMNVLLASVTERTREIGISKAVGARKRDVLAQYLAESVAIAALGAVLGTALGYGVAQVVAAFMRQRATIPVHAGFSASTMLVAVGAPLVVGVCFGMYPALRASRLSPIDAIRHE